jgi:S1-C subfamily serine protease
MTPQFLRHCSAATLNMPLIPIFAMVGLLSACCLVAEAQVAEVMKHEATAEICQRLQIATVRIVSNNDRSSGVIVSSAGHILTVAHGLHGESRTAAIVFHDGAKAEAEIILRDKALDVAVLKLTDDSTRPALSPISIAPAGGLRKTALVLAAGCPGREPDGLRPVIRLGELLAVEPTTLRSSCTLTAGDSGGPLVNHQGQLIGLHRQIGLSRESNHHLPLEHLKNSVKSILDLQKMAAVESSTESGLAATLPIANRAVTATMQLRRVEIFQGKSTPDTEAAPLILGTLLNSEYVATKLSELTPHEMIDCRFQEGDPGVAEIAMTNVALDLAILKLQIPRRAATSLVSQPVVSAAEFSLVFAASVQSEPVRVGLITRRRHYEPRLNGKLGAVLDVDETSRAVRVKEVAPNSTASVAGLSKTCLIDSINGQPVKSLDNVGELLSEHQPGDWLQFQFRIVEKSSTNFARLQHDPAERFERTEFLDGRSGIVSERRSGFADILQHDIELAPSHCGGPLIDSEGRVIGVNIARRARESSLAIPIEVVLQLLKGE